MYLLIPILIGFVRIVYYSAKDSIDLDPLRRQVIKAGRVFPESDVQTILHLHQKSLNHFVEILNTFCTRLAFTSILILLTRSIALPWTAILWNGQIQDIAIQTCGVVVVLCVSWIFVRSLPKPDSKAQVLSHLKILVSENSQDWGREFYRREKFLGQPSQDLYRKSKVQSVRLAQSEYKYQLDRHFLCLPLFEVTVLGFFVVTCTWAVALAVWSSY